MSKSFTKVRGLAASLFGCRLIEANFGPSIEHLFLGKNSNVKLLASFIGLIRETIENGAGLFRGPGHRSWGGTSVMLLPRREVALMVSLY